jgi:lysophospholipase L1-like esterase
MSGYTTTLTLKHFDDILDSIPNADRSLLVVCFGANDSAIEPSIQHVPLEKYSENLKSMIDIIQTKRPTCTILLATPVPVIQEAWDKWSMKNHKTPGYRSWDVVEQYANAVRNVGKEKNVVVADLWQGNEEKWKKEENFTDGLHLSKDGYQIMFDGIKDAIETNVKEFAAADMAWPFEHWATAIKK